MYIKEQKLNETLIFKNRKFVHVSNIDQHSFEFSTVRVKLHLMQELISVTQRVKVFALTVYLRKRCIFK